MSENFQLYVDIVEKVDKDKFVFGPVLLADTEDLQGDVYDSEEVEKAAWRFAKNGFLGDEMHKKDLDKDEALFVESFVWRPGLMGDSMTIGKKTYETTTWFAGAVLGDDLWSKVEKGKIRGFSISGTAIRVAEAA